MSGVPPIHHVGYVVDDLAEGVDRAVATLGAGPFFAIEHLTFDEVTFAGGPAVYDHSSAFGAWGPLLVELTVVHDAQPAGLADALVAPGGGIGHVAWLADDLDAEVARLTALGCEPFHTGRTGPASAVWLHGGPLLAHPIEVLQRADQLLGFYAMLRDAAEGWDGRDPLRPMA
jgi:catechol 2,3-dioxygenase-like lactoylglutathione lyase family enzyme